MVCRVKNEFSAASDGTKLADGQGIAIALGVMVQHAVALKIPRVIHIVIVGGVFPHLNGRVFDNIFQVNGAVPLGTGIYLPIRYHVISSGMVIFFCIPLRSLQYSASQQTTSISFSSCFIPLFLSGYLRGQGYNSRNNRLRSPWGRLSPDSRPCAAALSIHPPPAGCPR